MEFLLSACVTTVMAFSMSGCGGGDSSGGEGGADARGVAGAGNGGETDEDLPPGFPADEPVCEANATELCDCSGDDIGSRRCNSAGTAWGECACIHYGKTLFAAPGGASAGAGGQDEPLSLDAALTELASTVGGGLPDDGAVIWLRGGVYELSETLTLGGDYTGQDGKPVAVRGYPGESVVFSGGQALEVESFSAVTSDSPVWGRLDEAARDHIVQIDLGALGLSDYGALSRRGFCGSPSDVPLELFIDGERQELARWPDASAHDAMPTPEDDNIEIYGTVTPDVTGSYTRVGENDGVGVFERDDLVDGEQYRLYRRHWEYEGTWHRAWFLSTREAGEYPGDTNGPSWSLYSEDFGALSPNTNAGASGQVVFAQPTDIHHGLARTLVADSDTVFQYAGTRPERWAAAEDLWLHGIWKETWSDCHVPGSVDSAAGTITLGEPAHYGLADNKPFYAYNLVEEITAPGEWYLERSTGVLYLYPPAGFDEAAISVSLLDEALLDVSADYFELHDVTFEDGRGRGLEVSGSEGRLAGVVVRNLGRDGVTMSGTNNIVSACLVHDVGGYGVQVTGGDRATLNAGGHIVEDCTIHDFGVWEWTYRPGVRASGVGNVVRHNLIHSATHSAILYGGNDHLIEKNEIHNVCSRSSDAGAIYAGRDWGARGNRIHHNFIHHVQTTVEGYGVHGIYLDDCLSGISVMGNVLYEISGHAIQHGGGRDNLMVGNVMARCGDAVRADTRGYDWWESGRGPKDVSGDSWNLLEKLQQWDYQNDPWASRWPECAEIPNSWAEITAGDGHWLYPEGSVFDGNIGWQNGDFMSGTGYDWYASTADNVEDTDPLFSDEASLDLSLSSDSPARDIPGWEEIPFSEIGPR